MNTLFNRIKKQGGMTLTLAIRTYREIEEFAEWAANLTFIDLPKSVVNRARMVLIDDLGAILGGSIAPELAQFRNYSSIDCSQGKSTVLCEGYPKTNTILAAQLNGIAGCWEELDEGYRLATSHAGIYTIPTLLAVAEEIDVSLEDVFTALVVGYECGARFGEAWKFPAFSLHPHGVFVTISSAVAGAKLKGYTSEEIRDAILTASTLTIASPYDHAVKGSLARNLWTGIGAAAGLNALYATKSGITGIPSTIESVFSNIYKAEFVSNALTSELGERYAINSGYHKLYACCQYSHSAIDALLAIRERNKKFIRNISDIEVRTHSKALSLKEIHPQTTLGAKFSLPHIMSAVWYMGTGGMEAFTKESIVNPEIYSLRENIRSKEFEPISLPYDRPSEVTVFFKDGTTDSELMMSATGDPEKPMNVDMIVGKFMKTVSDIVKYPKEVTDFILEGSTNEKINILFSILKKSEESI